MPATVCYAPDSAPAARKPLRRFVFSLSARLLATCVIALAISLGATATAIVYVMEHYSTSLPGHHPEFSWAKKLVTMVQTDSSGRPTGAAIPVDSQTLIDTFPDDVGYRIADAHGNAVLSEASVLIPFSRPGNDEPLIQGRKDIAVGGKIFHVGTVPIPKYGAGNSGQYFAQVSLSEHFEKLNAHFRLSSVPTVVYVTFSTAVLIFGLTLRFTLRSMLMPISDASDTAAKISPRNLSARLKTEHVPTELRPLIDAFNGALMRLENGYKAQQLFLGSAAHEMQTPLTLIRGQIEMQHGLEKKDSLLQDIDLMARQVRQLLHLAELSEAQNYAFTICDVVAVIHDVVHFLERKAKAKNVRLAINVPADGLVADADKSALFILLKNLLENALAVAPDSSVISLSASSEVLLVEDEGPGIDPSWIPHLFDRFWRGPDASYDGAGLGLAICKEIATAHGWNLSVRRRPCGACFQIALCAPSTMS